MRRKDSLRGAETAEISVRLGNYSASHFEGSAHFPGARRTRLDAPRSGSYAGRHTTDKTAPLATEGQQQLFLARVTAEPQKAVSQDAALHIVVKLALHIGGKPLASGSASREARKVSRWPVTHLVEHRPARITVHRWPQQEPYLHPTYNSVVRDTRPRPAGPGAVATRNF